jgi:hypothetical protein
MRLASKAMSTEPADDLRLTFQQLLNLALTRGRATSPYCGLGPGTPLQSTQWPTSGAVRIGHCGTHSALPRRAADAAKRLTAVTRPRQTTRPGSGYRIGAPSTEQLARIQEYGRAVRSGWASGATFSIRAAAAPCR